MTSVSFAKLDSVYPTAPDVHVPSLAQLETLLDEVVYEQAGPEAATQINRIRQLATERRSGLPDAEERLVRALDELDASLMEDVIRPLTLYFDLANLAEELNRFRTLRRRSTIVDGIDQQRETIFKAIESLKHNGLPAAEVRKLVRKLRIEPVFTAHPSEAKRRTTRAVLRRSGDSLAVT